MSKVMNFGNNNKNNKNKKNDLNTTKFKTKPENPDNESKSDNSNPKDRKTMRVTIDAYSVLDTWRRIMSDNNHHFTFNDVIESINDDLLNTLPDDKKNKFERLYRRVVNEHKSTDDDDFTL